MNNVKSFVKDFLENPYQISILSAHELDQDVPSEFYYDYLALLHLILVKKNIKNGFISPILTNTSVISNALDLEFSRTSWNYEISIPENNNLSKDTTERIKKLNSRKDTSVLWSNNKSFLEKYSTGDISHQIFGEIDQFPKCCIDSFVSYSWCDYEIASEITGSEPVNAEKIIRASTYPYLSEKMFERQKQIQMENMKTRQKFPFVFHQSCPNCLINTNSPTAKLNAEWKKICQNEFEQLHDKIINESKRVIDNIMNMVKTWEDEFEPLAESWEAEYN